MADFTEAEVLRLLGKLANKWGTGHESVTKILGKVDDFLEEKKEKINFLSKVQLFVAMLRDHSQEKYYIDDGNLGLMIACLAYLVLPFDLVPDMIPVIGFADDATAFTLVVTRVAGEIEQYKQWRIETEEPLDGDFIDVTPE